MSMKRDTADIRIQPKGIQLEICLIHNGRKGRQTVGPRQLVNRDKAELREGVVNCLKGAAGRLRLSEGVHAEWLKTTSTA